MVDESDGSLGQGNSTKNHRISVPWLIHNGSTLSNAPRCERPQLREVLRVHRRRDPSTSGGSGSAIAGNEQTCFAPGVQRLLGRTRSGLRQLHESAAQSQSSEAVAVPVGMQPLEASRKASARCCMSLHCSDIGRGQVKAVNCRIAREGSHRHGLRLLVQSLGLVDE